MKSKKKPQHNTKDYVYNIGDYVYFHAYADNKDKTTYFICKGYVIRQPKPDSKVYKVVVTEVNPKSVLCGESPDVAKTLLGRKIARKLNQLSEIKNNWVCTFYGEVSWLKLDQREEKKIQSYLARRDPK